MTKGNLYKHKNCTDTAIYVCYILKFPKYAKVTVQWFNIVNPKNRFNLNIVETIEIKTDDLENWELIG